MPLTDSAIRTAKPGIRTLKLFDERGLFLQVAQSGGKWWRFKYRFGGKHKTLSMGVYPDVSLKLARQRRDDARHLLAEGVDPSENRKARKAAQAGRAANSFEVVAREWLSKRVTTWAKSHAVKVDAMLERDIYPYIGARPIAAINAPELLDALRRIENRGALDTAKRARQTAGQIFRYAVATGRAERDPSGDLRGALAPPVQHHFAAVTEPKDVGPLLIAMDGYHGSPIVRAALRLAPIVFVRPGELRKARWAEIDLQTAEWRIPAERMKVRQPHIVPLSTQAVDILTELYLLTGNFEFVFPSARSRKRPMSDNAVLAAMRRMGIDKETMCGHGFRAMARTILDEVLNYRVDLIEHQLAHAVKDANGRAYNRTAHLDARKLMMQGWSDYLDLLRHQAAGSNVVPMKRASTTMPRQTLHPGSLRVSVAAPQEPTRDDTKSMAIPLE